MQLARRIIDAWNRRHRKTDPLEEERQSAFGVWRYGYEYVKASKTIGFRPAKELKETL